MTSDPLYAALLKERFGPSLWWTEEMRPDLTDKRIQQFLQEPLTDELKEAV